MRLKIKRYVFTVSCSSLRDPMWWATDRRGFKTTYLASIHLSTHPDFPGVTALHLILGPLRLLVGWREAPLRSWLGPLYACFALSVFCLMDDLMMGRWAWAAVSLFFTTMTACHVATTEQRKEALT